MCVIFVCDKERPTDEMVEKAFDTNNSGAGIAWREKGNVRWEKGLDVDEIKELCKTAPIPFVAHFRIPSCGGVTPALCHPFPIEKDVNLALSGNTKSHVLFHNGHWGQWKATVLETAVKRGAKLPVGKWSDSRGMAWTAYHYGLGILEMIDEKTIAFGPGPDDLELTGSGWAKVNGVWCSNKLWEGRTVYQSGMYGNRGAGYFGTAPASLAGSTKSEVKTDGKEDKKEETGGSPAVTPFVWSKVTSLTQALDLFSKGTISKKQLKRIRRAIDSKSRKEKSDRATALAPFSLTRH